MTTQTSNITTAQDIRKGDLFTSPGGDVLIAMEDATRRGPVGEAAKLTTIQAAPRNRAGRRADGVFELGTTGIRTLELPNEQPVALHERGVATHHHMDEAHTLPNISSPEYPAALKRCQQRCEILRLTAIRAEQVADQEYVEEMFREQVREAIAANVPVAALVEDTGLSRARIYQIRDGVR